MFVMKIWNAVPIIFAISVHLPAYLHITTQEALILGIFTKDQHIPVLFKIWKIQHTSHEDIHALIQAL
jgi:Kef-type K+ transport system membrane component KefB